MDENCRNLERRIEMTLGGGYQRHDDPTAGHCVTLIDALGFVLRWL